MGIVSSLTIAERRKGAIEDEARRKKVARKLLTWKVLWDTLRLTRHRYRDQFWPLVLLGVLWVSGALARGAYPVGVLATSMLGAAVTVFYLRQKLTRRTEWGYAGSCLAAAAGWLVAVSLAPDARWPNVVGVLAWAGLSLIWWRHHEVRGWPGQSRSTLVNRWAEHVRDLQGGPLAGAEIEHPVPFEHGNSYTVNLVPGKQTLDIAMAALPKLETALDTPMQYLVLERHPDFPKKPSKLRLQEITRSPIENTVYFDQPRHEDGCAFLGQHADGIGEASIRIYTENSMHSTNLTGGTGVGKTRLMETIALTALDMRNAGQHTVIFYMDGQDGASSPILFKHATWAVGVAGAMTMLAALERIAAHRNRENRVNDWSGFTPTEERPGILVIIDEAHLILSLAPQGVRFANAAKAWRKLGISFLVAAHDSSLKTLLDDSLRAALLAGNGLVMHVSSRMAGNLIPGLGTNPADLPKIPGYGVVVGAANSGIRTAPFRGRYVPDEKDRAKAETEGKKLPVPTIEEWFSRYTPLELDKGARKAAGRDYTQRHARAEEERQALLDLFSDSDDEPAVDLDALQDGQPDPATNGAGPTCRDRLLALDWAAYGELGLQQIFTELPDVTNSAVTKALRGLVESGELERVAHGKYRRKASP